MMSRAGFQSWGGLVQHGNITRPAFSDELEIAVSRAGNLKMLASGQGRSYGDSCLNNAGHLIVMTRLNRAISFNETAGTFSAEAGITIGDILKIVLPRGYSLPVVPGTSHCTLGGAIANDVHGKDSAGRGCFGNWVRSIVLLRSTGERMMIDQNHPLFRATIGGLGLTGIIVSAEIKLVPIASSTMEVQRFRFRDLAEMWDLWRNPALAEGATVAWLDLVARKGAGVITTGSQAADKTAISEWRKPRRIPPIGFPLVNPATSFALNALQHVRLNAGASNSLESYFQFHFPLDQLEQWNRLYGKSGVRQYQCVIPEAAAVTSFRDMVSCVLQARVLCPLAVIKRFGNTEPVGLMSFARSGYSLAMDFAANDRSLSEITSRFDSIVSAASGRIYPAKDSRMPTELFKTSYPMWEKFRASVDCAFMSDFWRRVCDYD